MYAYCDKQIFKFKIEGKNDRFYQLSLLLLFIILFKFLYFFNISNHKNFSQRKKGNILHSTKESKMMIGKKLLTNSGLIIILMKVIPMKFLRAANLIYQMKSTMEMKAMTIYK